LPAAVVAEVSGAEALEGVTPLNRGYLILTHAVVSDLCGSSVQLVKQGLRILEFGGIEAFGEPAVEFGQH
jgi:hypothetical protein